MLPKFKNEWVREKISLMPVVGNYLEVPLSLLQQLYCEVLIQQKSSNLKCLMQTDSKFPLLNHVWE